MNEDSQHPELSPEWEARIVALVLGEASDFEREELERLIAERPELAAFREQVQNTHGLLHDIGSGEFALDDDAGDDAWKLSRERREHLFAAFEGRPPEPTGEVRLRPGSVGRQRFITQLSWVVAVFCVVGCLGSIVFFSLQTQFQVTHARAKVGLGTQQHWGLDGADTDMPATDAPAGGVPLWFESEAVRGETRTNSATFDGSLIDGKFQSMPQRGRFRSALGGLDSRDLAVQTGPSGSTSEALFDTAGQSASPAVPTIESFNKAYSNAESAEASLRGLKALTTTLSEDFIQDETLAVPELPKPSGPRDSTGTDLATRYDNGRDVRGQNFAGDYVDLKTSSVTQWEDDTKRDFSEEGRDAPTAYGYSVTPSEPVPAQQQQGQQGQPMLMVTPQIVIGDEEQESALANQPYVQSGVDGGTMGEAMGGLGGQISDGYGGYGGGGFGGEPSGAYGGSAAGGGYGGYGGAAAGRYGGQSQGDSDSDGVVEYEAVPHDIAQDSNGDAAPGSDRQQAAAADKQVLSFSSENGSQVRIERAGKGYDVYSQDYENLGDQPVAPDGEQRERWDAGVAVQESAELAQTRSGVQDPELALQYGERNTEVLRHQRLVRVQDELSSQINRKYFYDQSGPAAVPKPARVPSPAASQDTPSEMQNLFGDAVMESNRPAEMGTPYTVSTVEQKAEMLTQQPDSSLARTVPGISESENTAIQRAKRALKQAAGMNGILPGASEGKLESTRSLDRFYYAPPSSGASPALSTFSLGRTPSTQGLLGNFASPPQQTSQIIDFSLQNEKNAGDEAYSTFSLHVSDVSFQLARAALAAGKWPEPAKIRSEEFVNAFDYGDPLPSQEEHVACQMEQAIHPFMQQRNVLRVAMRTAALGRAANTPLRLTLLLDNSGSMERPDRQQTVRRAFAFLAQQLKPIDQVTLISFARQPRLLADQVRGDQASELVSMIENLPSEGGTNIESALQLAFEKAREQQAAGTQNRIVLLTDGAVNLGNANPESLSQMVVAMRNAGIAFDAAGIVADGLNDEVLEALTRQGDGRYYLLDTAESVDAGFARQIAGALRPSAKNVKVQVEFNPARVGRYRLFGFEKHRLKQEDFRNDQVDAAEMAAAEAGVAVYQFEAKPDGAGDVGSVSVRFRDLASGQMIERRWPIPYEPHAPRMEQAASSLRIATAAAMFAEMLRGDDPGESTKLAALTKLLEGNSGHMTRSARLDEFKQMLQQARSIGIQP